jgi:hypothetical protein
MSAIVVVVVGYMVCRNTLIISENHLWTLSSLMRRLLLSGNSSIEDKYASVVLQTFINYLSGVINHMMEAGLFVVKNIGYIFIV